MSGIKKNTRQNIVEMHENSNQLPPIPEHLSSPLVFIGVRVAQSLIFCVVFCTSFGYHINVRENRRGYSRIVNPDTRSKLGTTYGKKTRKTKETTWKTRKMSNTEPTKQ
jgi:hypothetical protein